MYKKVTLYVMFYLDMNHHESVFFWFVSYVYLMRRLQKYTIHFLRTDQDSTKNCCQMGFLQVDMKNIVKFVKGIPPL